jgi:ankyrin repeat protein
MGGGITMGDRWEQRGKGSLFEAVDRGDRQGIEDTLRRNRSLLNQIDTLGRTPLHHAAISGFGGIVELLLSYGAAIDAVDRNGCTALHCALFEGRLNAADILIGRDADLCRHDTLIGITPIHIAAAQGYLQMASMLIDRHVKVDTMESQGLTPLHISALKGDPNMTSLLLSRGAQVNARSTDDKTPLDCAMAGNSTGVIDLLSRHGAHFGGTTLDWETFAASRDEKKSTEEYLELLQSIRNGDRTVDFTLLRYLYALSSLYNPYGLSREKGYAAGKRQWSEIGELLDRKRWEDAIDLCELYLEEDYLDMDLHLLCAMACRESGKAEQELYHRYFFGRLYASVKQSGDGKSPERAYVVVRLREEYMILGACKGSMPVSQSLVAKESHEYDRFELKNQETGRTEYLFFNIDILRHRDIFQSVP